VPNVAVWFSVTPQPTVPVDVKLVLQGNQADCYWRTTGTADWTYMGQKTGIGWSISAYDEVRIGAHGGMAGGLDSILLTSSAVPEPTTFALLTTGLFGLLAYAWRRRR
jgi:hypothetical protein